MKKIAFVILVVFINFIPLLAGAQGIENPLPGINSFSDLFNKVLKYFQSIAGIIAVIFIIVGGVMYMISGGSKEMMEKAKKTLIFAIVGLVIVTAAPLFLQDITLVLKGGGGGGSKLLTVAMNVLRLLLSIVGTLGILGLLNSAVIMLVSTGDDKTLTAAKKSFAHACIGIALAAGSLILVSTMKGFILGA